MKKLFQILSKPAKWIFIIAAAVIGIFWIIYSIRTFDTRGFVPVLKSIILLVVGALVLLTCPVLLLLKREAEARAVFLFILGFWLIKYTQGNFELSANYANEDNALLKLAGIFAFFVALALVAVLVLTILELGFKKNFLRFFAVCAVMAAICFGFLAGLFMFISACTNKVPWDGAVQSILVVFGFTVTMFFGYLYLLGYPKTKQ